jgi:hypothetical protein
MFPVVHVVLTIHAFHFEFQGTVLNPELFV